MGKRQGRSLAAQNINSRAVEVERRAALAPLKKVNWVIALSSTRERADNVPNPDRSHFMKRSVYSLEILRMMRNLSTRLRLPLAAYAAVLLF